MFTTEVTEITENNHEKVEQSGRSLGGLAGFAEKASQVAGSFGTDECTRKSRNWANEPKTFAWLDQVTVLALFVLRHLRVGRFA